MEKLDIKEIERKLNNDVKLTLEEIIYIVKNKKPFKVYLKLDDIYTNVYKMSEYDLYYIIECDIHNFEDGFISYPRVLI